MNDTDFSLITFRSARGQQIYDHLFEGAQRMYNTGVIAEDKMLVAISWVILSVISEWERGNTTYDKSIRHLEGVVNIYEEIEAAVLGA